MMGTEDLLRGLTASIYEAAVDETLWHGVLGDIARACGGVGGIFVQGRWNNGFELSWIHENVPATEGRWEHYEAYASLDVRTAHAMRQPPFSIYTDYDIVTEREINHHPFYQEFMAAYGLRYTAGSRLPANGSESGIVNIFRNREQGHHMRREIEILEVLGAHLSKSAAVNRKLAEASRAEHRLREALDRVVDAIFILEPDGRIVDANRAGEHLLRANDGLTARNVRLGATHAPSRNVLAEAIATAAARLLTESGRGQAIPIPRPSGRPLQALVLPLPADEASLQPVVQRNQHLVMLVVSDPDRPPLPLSERLAALWGLTPAECRLATALAGGDTVRDYADKNCLTENTVRWTLKRLLAKLDCRRQSDLARLLSTATATWRLVPD